MLLDRGGLGGDGRESGEKESDREAMQVPYAAYMIASSICIKYTVNTYGCLSILRGWREMEERG
jgi:hypothetical protein